MVREKMFFFFFFFFCFFGILSWESVERMGGLFFSFD